MEKVRGRKSVRKGMQKKISWKRSDEERSAGEVPREKVCRRRSTGEFLTGKDLWEKVFQRRSAESFPTKRRSNGETRKGSVRKRVVAEKVILIPCEEKNNSLIFID